MNAIQFRQKREELNNFLKSIPENLKKEYLNYTVEDNKIFGVPVKGQQIYANALNSIDNIDLHKQYIVSKLDLLNLQNSLFGQGDPKLNKKIKNYKLQLKRLNNAIKKINTMAN
ncbi:hypothetical protein NST17_19625 [Caldifermentibacillus hisashii]|uniref:Uncharacterized protein n=1 Tax=Caldifermentibacillus hisashii TaxID=996558 RepID=A0ABU9K2Q8_9BACI